MCEVTEDYRNYVKGTTERKATHFSATDLQPIVSLIKPKDERYTDPRSHYPEPDGTLCERLISMTEAFRSGDNKPERQIDVQPFTEVLKQVGMVSEDAGNGDSVCESMI